MGKKSQSFNKGFWSAEEDEILTNYVRLYGEGKWNEVFQRTGLKRKGKSCRLRWLNYLRPDIKRGNISEDEEDLIIRLHKLLGNRWALIAGRIPGRTDNEIKNYWNSYLKKKLEEKKIHVDSKTPQLETAAIDETQCNNVVINDHHHMTGNNAESYGKPSSSSPPLSKLLLDDVDMNDKWWDRCYEHVLNFPESTIKADSNDFKDSQTHESNPLNLENLSKFLGLE